METVRETPRRRLKDLDGLRGLAALSVVLFHYTTRYDDFFGHSDDPLLSMPDRYIGAQPLFFIISGFVILLTITPVTSVLDFIVSRVSRIYPAYWIAVILAFAAMSLSGIWPEGRVSGLSAIVNLSMFQSFLNVENVDGAYWTLQYELTFYAIVVALLVVGMLKRVELVALLLLGISLLYWAMLRQDLFVTLGAPGSLLKRGMLLLTIFQHVQFFIAGMMLYRIWKDRPTPLRIGIIVAAVAMTWLEQGGSLALAHAAFVAIMVLAMNEKLPVLRSRPLVFLGSISYALYLVHQDLGYVAIREIEQQGVNANLAIVVTLAGAIGLATLISRLVERPAMGMIRTRYKAYKAGRAAAPESQPVPVAEPVTAP